MLRPALVAAVVTLTVLACAGRRAGDTNAPTATADSVHVEIINEYFYDARVHAVYAGGQRRSLGTIRGNGGHSRSTIVWEPRPLIFEVSFIIDGSGYVSRPVDPRPDESIELRLPANISESGFFRRVSLHDPAAPQRRAQSISVARTPAGAMTR